MMCVIALAGMIGGVMNAQDITGTWQGTLKANQSLRLVLQVTKDNGTLKGKFFSIDQDGSGITVSSITIQGGDFNFAISAFDITYAGKLSPDGKTATGNWKQGGGSAILLTLEHVNAEGAWAIPKPQERLPPMAVDADPSFDVATIKPSKPDQPGKAFTVRGARFVTINTTLEDLITFSYGIQVKQIVDAPAWAATDKFDIEAKPDLPGQPNDKQLKSMTRKLLEERFHLTYHHDKKELPVYALEVAKTGSKMEKNEDNPNGLPSLFFRGLGKLNVRNATMADFAHLMQSAVLDRPVVDQTALTGRFNFALNWTPDESQFGGLGVKIPPPTDAADAPPTLYTAIQEQIGLKLEPTKAPVDTLVVDKVEKPSEN
jgi:uncharacterized protein (TIGR03435 family)